MDRAEAYQLANQELDKIEAEGYAAAAQHIDTVICEVVSAPSGTAYDVEVSYHWEHASRQSILVICSVTSKSWFTHEKIEESITLDEKAI